MIPSYFIEKSKVKVSYMDCNRCKEQLDAYLDQELPAAEQEQVEEHLCQCEQCRRVLRQMERMQEAISHLQIQAPAEFAEKAVQQLQNETAVRKRKVRQWVSGMSAAVACLLLVFIGPAIFKQAGNKETAEQYSIQESAYAEPRETEDIEVSLTEQEVVLEENFSDSVQEPGYNQDDEPSSGNSSGNCLVESVSIEMRNADMQWLVQKLQSFWGEEASLYLEKTEKGVLLYDIAQYEEQLQLWLQEKGYQLPEYAAEMLYVELIST